MSQFVIKINSKGLRKKKLEALAKELKDVLGKGSSVDVQEVIVPESRSDRLSAAIDTISEGRSELEELRDELQGWYDNLPEAFQSGDKGQVLEEAIQNLETAINACEEAENAEVEFPQMYG